MDPEKCRTGRIELLEELESPPGRLRRGAGVPLPIVHIETPVEASLWGEQPVRNHS